MINTTAIAEDKVQVRISGNTFNEDLDLFKETIGRMDRKWDGDGAVWIVFHARRYIHVPWIRIALSDYALQLRMPL